MSVETNPYAAPDAVLGMPLGATSHLLNIASKGSRFGAWVIDYFCFAGLWFAFSFVRGNSLDDVDVRGLEDLPLGLINIGYNMAYYIVFEGIWATTPGKLVFGNIVVDKDGGRPGIGRIIGRTLCRFIPFEPLLYLMLERPLHDSIPGVYVVRKR